MHPLLFLIPLFPLLGFLFNLTVGVRLLGGKAVSPRPDAHGGPAAASSPIVETPKLAETNPSGCFSLFGKSCSAMARRTFSAITTAM